MTRHAAIRMLKTNKEIVALNPQAYLTFLALAIEIGGRDIQVPLAKIVKEYKDAPSRHGTASQNREYFATAQKHADADEACGRSWQCACGACRISREFGWKPKQERRPLTTPFGEAYGIDEGGCE